MITSSSQHDLEKQIPPQTHTHTTTNESTNSKDINISEPPPPPRTYTFCEQLTGSIIDVLIKMPLLLGAFADDAKLSVWKRAGFVLCLYLIALFLFAVLFPIFIFTVFFAGEENWIRLMGEKSRQQGSTASKAEIFFWTKQETKRATETILRTRVLFATRLGVGVLVWLAINLSVPRLRRAYFLGSLLWKWSMLAALMLLLIPTMLLFAFIVTSFIVTSFIVTSAISHYHSIYWMRGVEKNVQWVLYFASIILVWLAFFIAERDSILRIHKFHEFHKSHKAYAYRHIYKYIILTLFSFFIGAILGLVKIIVLVRWKSKYIYTRPNRERILVSLYYLCSLLLLDPDSHDSAHKKDIFEIAWILVKPCHQLSKENLDGSIKAPSVQDGSTTSASSADRRRPIDKFMSSIVDKDGVLSQHDIDQAAKWLASWIDTSKDETAPAALNQHFLQRIKDKYGKSKDKAVEELTRKMYTHVDKQEEDFLLNLFRLDVDNVGTFEDWTNKAYKTRFVFINKLHGSFALRDILFRILTVVQFVASFIFWLFITRLATAKVVLTMGSLFVGISFIFSDTGKTIVQGAIFSFYIHPFDVGDKVVMKVDVGDKDKDPQMVVQKMDTLTTTFYDEQKKWTVICPNSDLATKMIIKLDDDGNDAPKPLL